MDASIAVWVATHRVHALDPLFVGLGTVEKLGALWILAALLLLRRRVGPVEWALGGTSGDALNVSS